MHRAVRLRLVHEDVGLLQNQLAVGGEGLVDCSADPSRHRRRRRCSRTAPRSRQRVRRRSRGRPLAGPRDADMAHGVCGGHRPRDFRRFVGRKPYLRGRRPPGLSSRDVHWEVLRSGARTGRGGGARCGLDQAGTACQPGQAAPGPPVVATGFTSPRRALPTRRARTDPVGHHRHSLRPARGRPGRSTRTVRTERGTEATL